MPRRLTPASLLALALACTSSDDAPSDTDATTASPSSSSTGTADDPPLDTTAADSTGTDSGMTMGATDGPGSSSDDGPIGCVTDDNCTEPEAPFCINLLCAPCSAKADPDLACAGRFTDKPVCVASECVQCTATVTTACTGTTPLCDAEANTCIGCTSHDQCPDSACHIPYPGGKHATYHDGACFDPNTVVHVDGDGGMQFETIGEAVASFPTAGEGVIVVHDAASYNEPVLVDGNRMLAILAADGEQPQWIQTANGMGSHLSIEDSLTTVYLHRMRLSNNADSENAAIHLQGGRVHIQRSQIVANNGGGMFAEGGGLVYLENSMVGGNGGGAAGQHGLRIDGSTANILYTTIARNDDESVDSIVCGGASAVVVRNSILSGRDAASVECAGIDVSYSAVDEDLAGTANVDVGPVMNAWFENPTGGGFQLLAAGADVFCDIASWVDADPTTDIDGDARPTTDGTPDCAGADVP